MTKPTIRIEFYLKPIPSRACDWEAWDDATYGGEPDDLIGYGATEQEAIDDLMAQIEERDDD